MCEQGTRRSLGSCCLRSRCTRLAQGIHLFHFDILSFLWFSCCQVTDSPSLFSLQTSRLVERGYPITVILMIPTTLISYIQFPRSTTCRRILYSLPQSFWPLTVRNRSDYSHLLTSRIKWPVIFPFFVDDDRVVPLHSFKLAATLQEKRADNPHPLLIRIDKKAGHGAGKSTEKRYVQKSFNSRPDRISDFFDGFWQLFFWYIGSKKPRISGASLSSLLVSQVNPLNRLLYLLLWYTLFTGASRKWTLFLFFFSISK